MSGTETSHVETYEGQSIYLTFEPSSREWCAVILHVSGVSIRERSYGTALARAKGCIDGIKCGGSSPSARDYETLVAGKRVAGPFTRYDEAKAEADRAGGYVSFVPKSAREHEARDFEKIDDAAKHWNAKYVSTRGPKTFLYGVTSTGPWELEVFHAEGRWHAHAKPERISVLPSGLRPLDDESPSAAREMADDKPKPVRRAKEKKSASADAPCVPWVKVTKDPARYATCLARAKKLGPMTKARAIYDLLQASIMKEDQEVFLVVLMDVRGQLRGVAEVARGQRDTVQVGIDDVLRAPIVIGARYFTVVHNHPTGIAEPSPSDRSLTSSIEKAAEPFRPNLRFTDHIVIGSNQYYSFANRKLVVVSGK